MAKPIGIRIRQLFDILLSVTLVIAGLCLILGCIRVYMSPEGYSREAVIAAFSKIAIPVYLAVFMIAVSFVWELITPSEKAYHKAPAPYAQILFNLHRKRDLSADSTAQAAIAAEQAARKTRRVISMAAALVGCAVFLIYAVQPRHYDTADINNSMIRAMWVAIPCFLIPAAVAVFATYRNRKSYQHELELLKALPAKPADADTSPEADVPQSMSPATRWILLAVLLAAAVGFIAYGLFTGGTVAVLAKAINICTECIGLG